MPQNPTDSHRLQPTMTEHLHGFHRLAGLGRGTASKILRMESWAHRYRQANLGRRIGAAAGVGLVSLMLTTASATEMAKFQVRLEAPGGQPIAAERYLAVAGEDHPWADPVAEACLPEGESEPVWALPAGSYRFVCSALGFHVDYRGRITLREGELVEQTFELQPLVPCTGHVLSAVDGSPIAGAQVGPVTQFEPYNAYHLSRLGQDHLRRNYVAVTNKDGFYSLPVAPGKNVSLWVEFPGLAPAYLHHLKPTDGEFADVWLEASGGGLDLEVILPAQFPRAAYSLALRPEMEEHQVEALPRRMLWVPASSGPAVHWSSLPTGSYQVWLKGPAAGKHNYFPFDLGKVRVKEGQTVRHTRAGPEPC